MYAVTVYWKVDGSTRSVISNGATEEEAIADAERIYGKHESLIKVVKDLKLNYEGSKA